EVLPAVLRGLAPRHDAVPLGLVDALLLLHVRAGCGHAELAYRGAALGVLHLWVLPEVADDDDLIDSAAHRRLRLYTIPSIPPSSFRSSTIRASSPRSSSRTGIIPGSSSSRISLLGKQSTMYLPSERVTRRDPCSRAR